ncbi:hypothetical protein L916_13863 [Phytophthora nicotianae]|uniref:ZSWIM1/3 RNaseH-like domain-containing protein n=1 Tax=Phytophthora nicotianae TaxID=4792 RepID=W2IJS4_PHYNI|nr:hypothetical protein L916_13863 [Phytophthora nicotianae]
MADEDSLVLPSDIANTKKASRLDLLATQTNTEALFSLLEKYKFHYTYKVDDSSNRLQYLLWAHPTTTKLAKQFMDILVLDCTYKTNKYGMPLLNVIVLIGMNTILPIAQIWLPGESEPDLLWALNLF